MATCSVFNSRDPELVLLTSNDVMENVAVKSVKSVEKLGTNGKTAFIEML